MRLLSDDKGSGTSLFAKKDLTLCEKYSKMKQVPAKRKADSEGLYKRTSDMKEVLEQVRYNRLNIK